MVIRGHIIHTVLFFFLAFLSLGQTEEEIKEDANELFENEQYVKATSLYLRLISLNPKDGDYNYKYGTCLLFNSHQKKEALRYLNFAAKQPSPDPRAYYFYGKALHLNYEFDAAIKNYNVYLSKRPKKDKRYNVEREIKMCKNGKRLLTTFTDIVVSEKKEIDKEKFFRLYQNMQTVGGNILVSEEFQSKIDKKKGHIPIIHYPPQAKAIYYSSYGDNEASGKDLFVRRRLPNNKWGDPQKLTGEINTNEDEDFPFMHSSGDYIFFSSKGHNSMGGYDIFMASLNHEMNRFEKIENVDFAISSPDDDLFYVVDSTFQNAYFASARQSQDGKYHVYNVRVARVPIREVIIMGDFLSEINPENKEMNVRVSSFTNNEEVGQIKSNSKGKYSFVFPKGGKYNYEVSINGSEDIYKFVVDVPFLDEFRPLKQKAVHKSVDGEEIVSIVNLFDEAVEGAEALMAEVIRRRSELEVNTDQFDLEELDAQKIRNEVLADLGYTNMSMREVSDQLEDLALTEQLKKDKVENIERNLNAEIIEKTSEIKSLKQKQNDLENLASNESDPTKKHELLSDALTVTLEINQLSKEINGIETLKNESKKTLGDDPMNNAAILETKFNELMSAEKETEALKLLANSKELINKTKSESPDAIVKNLINESIALTNETEKLRKEELDFEKSKLDLQNENIILTNRLSNAKKKEAESIRSKINENNEEIALLDEVLQSTTDKISQKNEELSIIDNNIASLQSAMLEENDIAISEEHVNQSLKESQAISENAKPDYFEDQLLVIEEKHPELNPNYVADVNSTYESEVDDIASNIQSTTELINADDSKSELEKEEALFQNNTGAIDKINDRIGELESDLKNNPTSAEIKNELDELNTLKENTIKENQFRSERIEELKSSSNPTEMALTKDDVLNEVVDNYNEQTSDIKKNESLSEVEKLENLQALDSETLAALNKELTTVNTALQNNPSSQELKTKVEILNQIINEKKTDVEQRTEQIENINASVSESVTIASIENEILPKYEKEVSRINNSNNTNLEKLTALQELDQSAIKALNKESEQVEKKISDDSNNSSLAARSEKISELIALKENKISERAQMIAMEETVNNAVDTQPLKQLEQDLFSPHDTEVAKIENSELDEEEKAVKILELTHTYDLVLAKKKSEVQAEIADDPNNKNLLAQLNALDVAIEENKASQLVQVKVLEDSIDENAVAEIISKTDKSYSSNIAQMRSDNEENKFEQIEAREVELQENLKEALESNKTSMQRKWSVSAELERLTLEKAIEESKTREISASNNSNEIVNNTTSSEDYIADLRENGLGDNSDQLNAEYADVDQLNEQDQVLAQYESQLKTELQIVQEEINNDGETEILKIRKEAIQNEIEIVKEKRRNISVTIGELEQELIRPSTALSTNQQIEENNNANKEMYKELKTVAASSETNSIVEKALEANEKSQNEINDLIVQSSEAKSEEEKQYILKQIEEKQAAANDLIQRTIENNKRSEIEDQENISLLTNEELIKRKRSFTVQIGELTTSIIATEDEINDAKRKEIPGLETKKASLIAERSVLEEELRTVEELLSQNSETSPVVNPLAFEEVITFNEERQLAGDEKYEAYFEAGSTALETERRISLLEQELRKKIQATNALIALKESEENDAKISSNVEDIKELNKNIDQLKVDLIQQKYQANELLPNNEDEAMKMQNLVARGIKPIKAVAIATLIQMPAEGFAINTSSESAYSESNPIPLDVASPSGLVYRVQIGAFAKPIPQNLYKEFNPVSGEKIEGTNITRYMAGFFNNSEKVTEARRDIRELGYSDAFIVAYCDGKRIGFGKARQLEASGECVPKGTNELLMDVAEKTAEKLGLPTTTEIPEVSELSYNQAPGASEADPIEMMQGLFFTVQIGVFNRPVSAAVVYNLPELSTVRLPTGQIRYNTGLYNSIEEAEPRRDEALKRGIRGAFVVAYYKGQRISLWSAKQLLKKYGTEILQTGIEKTNVVEEIFEPITPAVRVDSVSVENIVSAEEEKRLSAERIQIVTKKQFEEFPRDVLNRYNAEGAFYFDETDKRVKSVIYNHVDDLPRVYNFKDDIDTVYIPLFETQNFDTKILSIEIEGGVIPGDLMDWLLRFSYYREFEETENGLELKIFGIAENKVEEIQSQFRKFALDALIIEESQFELEEND